MFIPADAVITLLDGELGQIDLSPSSGLDREMHIANTPSRSRLSGRAWYITPCDCGPGSQCRRHSVILRRWLFVCRFLKTEQLGEVRDGSISDLDRLMTIFQSLVDIEV